MGDVINQSLIWKVVGLSSGMTALVSFPLGSPYGMSLGQFGYGGLLGYLFVSSFMWGLVMRRKRIEVSERVKGIMGPIAFVVLCSISVVYDKYVPGKSDEYTITSYGSFALMSVSLSRKFELGFETGFSAFFLQLFAAQLFKIKWFLLPIASIFCSIVIILRHCPESPAVAFVGGEEEALIQPSNSQECYELENKRSRELLTNESTTMWDFVGGVSAITGLVCFPLGTLYGMSLGKLGYGGLLIYLFVCSFMWGLMMKGKRIVVSERVKGIMVAIAFVVICSISVVYDNYLPGKSDEYTITSYGSFALMSISLSRKLELGFETGFTAFFLQLFAAQLFKIKWFLLPVALVFCYLVIILRHYSESPVDAVVGGDEEALIQPTNFQEYYAPMLFPMDEESKFRAKPIIYHQQSRGVISSSRSPTLFPVDEESRFRAKPIIYHQQSRGAIASSSSILRPRSSFFRRRRG